MSAPLVLLTILLMMLPGSAATAGQEPVDLELVLAVDASTSIDNEEFALQMGGIARAFRHPKVLAALGTGPYRAVAVSLIQWSEPDKQIIVVPWTVLRGQGGALALSARLARQARAVRFGGTAIGSLIDTAADMFDQNRVQGLRKIVDISGDGISNLGPGVPERRDLALARGITINGLAIVSREPDVGTFYRDVVIGGPDAFAVIASDFSDFARAIVAKLVREITSDPYVSTLPKRTRPRG